MFCAVNLFIVAFGILEGWSSPMNILLTSDDTTLPSGKYHSYNNRKLWQRMELEIDPNYYIIIMNALIKFQNLQGKITMEEASWVTSLLSVGALICNIFFGYITNNFGRKIPLLIIAVPTIVSIFQHLNKFTCRISPFN